MKENRVFYIFASDYIQHCFPLKGTPKFNPINSAYGFAFHRAIDCIHESNSFEYAIDRFDSVFRERLPHADQKTLDNNRQKCRSMLKSYHLAILECRLSGDPVNEATDVRLNNDFGMKVRVSLVDDIKKWFYLIKTYAITNQRHLRLELSLCQMAFPGYQPYIIGFLSYPHYYKVQVESIDPIKIDKRRLIEFAIKERSNVDRQRASQSLQKKKSGINPSCGGEIDGG